MKRILFTGKVKALTVMLKEISARYKDFTVNEYLIDSARRLKAKALFTENTNENTTRAATL